jgi:pyridine nucleotide-disulfide oxidoreductase
MAGDIKKLYLQNAQYYEDSLIDLHLNKKVVNLNAKHKLIKCDDGSTFKYNKVFLATGLKYASYCFAQF